MPTTLRCPGCGRRYYSAANWPQLAGERCEGCGVLLVPAAAAADFDPPPPTSLDDRRQQRAGAGGGDQAAKVVQLFGGRRRGRIARLRRSLGRRPPLGPAA